MIGIIDYGMGNLRSVQKAFETVHARATILPDPDALRGIDRLVLPGVGAFGDGMQHLRDRGWIEPIRQFAASGRPVLGICLGMQLFFESSEEGSCSGSQPVPGLALLPGCVRLFRPMVDPAGRPLKVPHMGWNSLRWSRPDPLLRDLKPGIHVYFVHSYYCSPAGQGITTAEADYGVSFAASAWSGNLWATQFHPEKSQQVGLQMLANFASV